MGVGKNIRRIRRAKDISQVELAKKVGISQAMLSWIERETKNPSLQVGQMIAQALGCKVEDLTGKIKL